VADGDPALKLRIVSALALAPIALLMVVLGGWGFVAFVGLAVALMALEWARLIGARFGPRQGWIAGLAVLVTGTLASLLAGLGLPLAALLVIALGGTMAAGGARLLGAPPVWVGLGVAYVGLPALALIWLRSIPGSGLSLLVWLMVVVWTTDSAAYFTGRTLGGPKLAPSISPAKTWSGFWGGIVGAALASAFLGWLADIPEVAVAAGFAAVLAVVVQAGDLAESALKRRAGVKDSGQLIPGHGGLLDRVDGLLFAAPALAIVGVVVGPDYWPW
jgi:phosphatidate cytidylyltransferase